MFFALAVLPIDFQYWEMGTLLFVQGCGMGMFAAPNGGRDELCPRGEPRGGLRDAGDAPECGPTFLMAIFFTIVIVGLSTGLGGSVGEALATARVGPPIRGS